jgi:hypothetical protein
VRAVPVQVLKIGDLVMRPLRAEAGLDLEHALLGIVKLRPDHASAIDRAAAAGADATGEGSRLVRVGRRRIQSTGRSSSGNLCHMRAIATDFVIAREWHGGQAISAGDGTGQVLAFQASVPRAGWP